VTRDIDWQAKRETAIGMTWEHPIHGAWQKVNDGFLIADQRLEGEDH
jgi:hypothetical protein